MKTQTLLHILGQIPKEYDIEYTALSKKKKKKGH